MSTQLKIFLMLLLILKVSRKNCLIKVIDLYHLILYPSSPTWRVIKNRHHIKKAYVEKVINFTIKKNSLRKLFVFDNEIYKETGGFSMKSPLVPLLANAIMPELESMIIKKVTWYRRNKVLLSLRRWYSTINETREYTISTKFV